MIPSNHSVRRPLRALPFVIAGGVLVLGGCDGGDAAETAVHEASIVLKTGAAADVASRGASTNADSLAAYRERRLNEALQTLDAHVGEGDGAFAGAAAVLASVAENGLAIEHEAELISALRELSNRQTVVRGVLGEWWKHHAIAASSATFDPKDSFDELNRLTSVLEEEIQQVRQSKAALDEKINALDEQIAEAMAQADAQRNQAAQIELESSRAAPAERPALAERVREHTRRADSYEFQAQRLQTRAGQLRPDAAEKGRHVERLQTQLRLLEDSRQQITEQQQTSADDAAAARRAARETEGLLFERSAALNDYLLNEVGELASSAERRLRSAVSNAGKSSDSARDSATLAKASAQHRLGDLHDRLGEAHATLADLFGHLASLPLEDTARFQALADERRASADEARRSAQDAYADAARSFRSIRVRGDAKDALNALADRLEGVEPESLDEFGGDDAMDETPVEDGTGEAPGDDEIDD
ncbi:MAG: hypothetical protein ACIARR_01445 [Phycisphaerales bacterium JB059]